MLTILLSIIGILVTILLVVGVHEFGHFIVAKMCGVKVLRFSIGFGKGIVRWHDKQGTEYVLACIPLGGYVQMLDENEDIVPENLKKYAYNRQPFYKKILVISAGPLFNLVFAFLLYWSMFVIGFVTIAPIVGNVSPHSIAAIGGLQTQQRIVEIDGKPTRTWIAVIINMLMRAGDKGKMQIEVKSPDEKIATHTLNLFDWHLDNLRPDPLKSIGITPFLGVGPEYPLPKNLLLKNKYGPVTAIYYAWQDVALFVRMNFMVLGKMLVGKISLSSLGGPITIFESAGNALNNGIMSFMSFLAFLSISIGMINVLPIPGLDGGHLLFQAIEGIRRKPLSQRMQVLMFKIGLVLLVFIMFQAILNDILRL